MSFKTINVIYETYGREIPIGNPFLPHRFYHKVIMSVVVKFGYKESLQTQ